MSDQHREQLVQAYQLIKQGERDRAAKIIQGVLQQDKSNADAWWLLANAFERDDLKIKSLRQLLSLRSDDKRAQNMLDDLQAPDDNGSDDFFDTPPAKPKNDDLQLRKQLPDTPGSNPEEMSNVVFFGSIGVIVIIGGLLLAALIAPSLENINFNFGGGSDSSPEETLDAAFDALSTLDIERLEELSCEADRSDFDEDIEMIEMQGMTLNEALEEEEIGFDLSQLGYEIVSNDGNVAKARLTGSIGISSQGINVTFDVDELMNMADISTEEDLITLVREDGEWRICSQ